MPINFPDNPSLNDTHTASGRTWEWNGATWRVQAPVGPTGPTGPAASLESIASVALQRVDGVAGVATPLGNSTGTVNLDLSLANAWTLTATGNVELTFSNPPLTGNDSWWSVWFTQDGTGGHTLTVPAALEVAGSLVTTAGGLTILIFGTIDGGHQVWLLPTA